jgi:tetratricopeptide (TPR) repeat protein
MLACAVSAGAPSSILAISIAPVREVRSLDAGRALQVTDADPDALYRDREQPASVAAAERIWAARLAAQPSDFEAAWKLARLRYWVGTQGEGDQAARRRALDDGMAAARTAIAARPGGPEGHFWLAATMGALAESHGLRQGLTYRGAIRDELERVLAIDPGFLAGSADRALGRWYLKVPALFGGSTRRSEQHLRRALAYDPQSVITRLFLAETLIDAGRKAEARDQLKAALEAPIDPEWAPEDRRYKQQARQLLERLVRERRGRAPTPGG